MQWNKQNPVNVLRDNLKIPGSYKKKKKKSTEPNALKLITELLNELLKIYLFGCHAVSGWGLAEFFFNKARSGRATPKSP